MVKFKKLLAAAMTGAMLLGVTAAAVPATNIYAAEDTTTETPSTFTIQVNYDSFTATISGSETNKYVVFEVLKENKSDSKVSSTYVYPLVAGSVTVDLSFLKASKPSFIRVRGNAEAKASEIKTVNSQPTKIKVKYTAGKETLPAAFTFGTTTATKNEDLEPYQYRTLYGSNFSDLESLNKDIVEIAGTTIVVRKKAVTDAAAEKDNCPVSAEVKVKIAAAPKAPKVSIDYTKGTIKLPKNAKVKVIYETEGTEAIEGTEARMEVTNIPFYIYDSTSSTYIQVTTAMLTDYFTLGENGIEAKPGANIDSSFYKSTGPGETAIEMSKNENLVKYVTYIPAIEGQPATSGVVETEKWAACSERAIAADVATILGLFDETKNKVKEVTESGFTLLVRTEASGKAPSNITLVSIKKNSEPVVTSGKNEVTLDGATLEWEVTATGVVYTAMNANFEYLDGEKWKTIKTGKPVTVKGAITSSKVVEVRKAGIKDKDEKKSSLPSISIPITLEAYQTPIKSVAVDITDAEKAKLQAGGNAAITIACTATVKDENDKNVENPNITWTVLKKGETEKTEGIDIADGTISITADAAQNLTAGDVYVVTATCGGESNSAELLVAAAPGSNEGENTTTE